MLLRSLTTSTYNDYQLRNPLLFALIIGINNYQNQIHLRGAVADAKAFKNYLTTCLGVDESRIISLIDKEATRAKIIEKFKFLSEAEAIQRGHDPIVIFFAGHGGDAPSPPGWEAGGPGSRTQFLIAHDSSAGKKARICGIPDRTVAALLNRIAERKGDNIVSFLASKIDFLLIHSADGYPRLLPFRFWNSWHCKRWDSFCSHTIFYPSRIGRVHLDVREEESSDRCRLSSNRVAVTYTSRRMRCPRDCWRSPGTHVSGVLYDRIDKALGGDVARYFEVQRYSGEDGQNSQVSFHFEL